VFGAELEDFATGSQATIRFKSFADGKEGRLPVAIRNFERNSDSIGVGCRYLPRETSDHKMIADLIFADSSQWTQFQMSRRGNPGLLRGTGWFLRLAFFQTGRGLIYLWRHFFLK